MTHCTLVAVRKILYVILFRKVHHLKSLTLKIRICYKLTFHVEVLSNYNSLSHNRTLNLFWLESYKSFLCGSLTLSSVSFSYKFRFQLLVRCPGRFLGARERSHFSSAHSSRALAAANKCSEPARRLVASCLELQKLLLECPPPPPHRVHVHVNPA